QAHAGANRAVCNVEGGKADFTAAALLQVKIDEINDLVPSRQETVSEISGNPAKNQAKGNLAGQSVRIEMMPREKQRDQGEQGDQGQRVVVAAKQAPRRASVSPMDEFEETVNDDTFVVGRQCAQ